MINLRDCAWYDAPIPCRWHLCKTWSIGYDHGLMVERCACGGIRIAAGPWTERNSRRKTR